jgi:GT2 family glycosyltransferase
MVSIILVNYFHKDYLKRCLESIKKNKEAFEIIIVNNSPKESLKEIKLKNPEIKIVDAENLGYGGGNNFGSTLAKGEYLVFLNPDWLSEALEVFKRKECGIIMSKILSLDGKIINSRAGEVHYTGFSWSGGYGEKNNGIREPYEVAFASGASLFISRKLFKILDGFDSNFFMYVEDLDLSFRARLLGKKVFCAPKSEVFHDYQFKKGDYKLFYLERNRLFFVIKNYSLRMIVLIIFPFILLDFALWGYFFIIGKPQVKFRALKDFLKNYSKVVQKRKKIQETRKVPDAKLIKYFQPVINTKVIDNFVLKYIVNPFFESCWFLIKPFLK